MPDKYENLRVCNACVWVFAAFLGNTGLLHAAISLSPTTTNIAAGGGTSSVQVTATDQSITWTAAVDQTWVTFTSSTSGTGNGSVSYRVAGNPNGASRTATITVTPSQGSATTLVVSQAAGSLSISPSSANIGQNGSSGTVSVFTEDPLLQWTAVSSDAGLSISSGSTGIGSGAVQWTAATNTTNKTRTATITVTPLGGVGQAFTVSQQASADPRITLNPSSANVDPAGGSSTIFVSATDQTLTWAASSDQSWLTISSGTGTGNGSFSFTAAPNPQTTSRTATITVNPSRGPKETLTVTQSGAVLTINPTSANVPASGGTGSVSLTTTASALQWTVTSNQTWLTITSGASGQGSGTVQWSAAANTSSQGRSATLTITPSSGTSLTFSVNQAGAITGTLTLTPSSANVPPSISTGTVQVTSTNQQLTWTAASNQSWLTITSGSSGTGNGTIQYTSTGNTGTSDRTATITVTPSTGTAVSAVVTQAGTTATISPTSATVPGTGGTGSFLFSTNNTTLQWTVSSNQAWLTLTSPLSGTADATMTWAASANASTTPRTGTITITPAAGPALTFTVTQQGLTGTITVTPSPVSFSYQQLSSPPTDVQLTVAAGGVGLAFTASATTSSGGNWLSVTGTPGTTPGVINVSAHPLGLAAGVYQGTITITAAGATNSPVTVPVTLTVTAAPVLTAQPNALTFSFQQNGPEPAVRTVLLGNSGTALDSLDFTIVPDPSAPWLNVTGTSPTPATLTVNVNPAGLQPGTYQGTITVIAPRAGNSPFTIPVTLTVSAAPTMVPSPLSLSVTYRQLDALPAPISLAVNSSGDNFAFTADVSPSGSWLSIQAINPAQRASGQTPSSIQIGINPTGLAPGTYQGSVILMSPSAGNSPLTVPVTLTVLAGPALSTQPQLLSFNLTQGVDTSASGSIAVSSDPSVSFTTSVQTNSGGAWLAVSSSGTQTPATLTVSVQSAGLAPGTYQGFITLTSAQATNSPVVIPVTLTISAEPRLIVLPTQLNFSYRLSSGLLPPDEFIVIGTSDHAGAAVVISAATSSGGNWLSATHGVTAPGAAEVTVDPSGLGAGIYAGTLTLNSPGYVPVIVPVTLRVVSAPVLNVQPTTLSFSYQQNGTLPAAQSVAVSTTLPILPFTPTVAPGAAWLTVAGGGLTPSNFSVSVNPQGLAPGSYSGTVMVTSALAGTAPFWFRCN